MVFATVLFGLVSMVSVFSSKKLLFQREFWSGTYGILPWALSFMIVEVPQEMVHMITYAGIVLLMTKMDAVFYELWITCFLAVFSGGSFGVFLGAITRNPTEASLTIPGMYMPCDVMLSVS